MQFPLTITTLGDTDGRSETVAIMAEAELGPLAAYGSPEFFFGKLLDASEGQILRFKSAPELRAGFRGSGYRFEQLEPSGTFKLVRCA